MNETLISFKKLGHEERSPTISLKSQSYTVKQEETKRKVWIANFSVALETNPNHTLNQLLALSHSPPLMVP